ncbi:MAG: LuxR C-terminal-related transcriptional regulator [Candidatus Competibacteraceae bacterium]
MVLDAAARHLANAAESLEHQLATLTEREREVLNQTLTGSTSKEIARELSVSPRTVEAHRQNLLRKLGIGTVKELIASSGSSGAKPLGFARESPIDFARTDSMTWWLGSPENTLL